MIADAVKRSYHAQIQGRSCALRVSSLRQRTPYQMCGETSATRIGVGTALTEAAS
jgi:hypothetical protein